MSADSPKPFEINDIHVTPASAEDRAQDVRPSSDISIAKSGFQRFRENRLVTALFLLFLFPVGLYLVWRRKDWSKRRRIAWTTASSIIFLFLLLAALGAVLGSAAEASFASATHLWDTNHKAEAIEGYRKLLRDDNVPFLDPTEQVVVYRRAIDFDALNDNPEEAKKFIGMALAKHLSITPESPEAQAMLSQAEAKVAAEAQAKVAAEAQAKAAAEAQAKAAVVNEIPTPTKDYTTTARLGTGPGWYLIDKKGSKLSGPFEKSIRMSEGLAAVSIGGKWGFIDLAGKLIIQPQYDEGGGFEHGYAVVNVGGKYNANSSMTEGGWAVIDRSGTVRISQLHLLPTIGMNRVFVHEEWDSPETKVLDMNGLVQSILPFVLMGNPDEGNFSLMLADGKNGYVNSELKVIITPQFHTLSSFSEGFASVQRAFPADMQNFSDDYLKMGFINKEGKVVIPYQFNMTHDFSGGLAAVQLGDIWGYINSKGLMVFQSPDIQDLGDFAEGLAPVKVKGKWGYIDQHGNWKVQPQFDKANMFQGGLAAVENNDKWGFIDKDGHFAIKAQLEAVISFEEDRAFVKQP